MAGDAEDRRMISAFLDAQAAESGAARNTLLAYGRDLADLAAWVRTGTAPEGASTGEDNLKSLALMLAAIRSARRDGAPIEVQDVLLEAGR